MVSFLNFNCVLNVNLWLEGDIRGGDIRVAADVRDGGVKALTGEGGTHREDHQPGSGPGLCLGFSSISKSFVKCLDLICGHIVHLPSIEVFSPNSLQT